MSAAIKVFSSQQRQQAEKEKKQQQQQADLIKQIADQMGIIQNKISGK